MVVLGSQRGRQFQQKAGHHMLLQIHPGSHPARKDGDTVPKPHLRFEFGGLLSLVTAHFELPWSLWTLTQAQNTSSSLGGTYAHLFFLLHLLLAPSCPCARRMTILSHLAHSELSVSS